MSNRDNSGDVLWKENEFVAYIEAPSKNWKMNVNPYTSKYYPGGSWNSIEYPLPDFLQDCQEWEEVFPKIDNLVGQFRNHKRFVLNVTLVQFFLLIVYSFTPRDTIVALVLGLFVVVMGLVIVGVWHNFISYNKNIDEEIRQIVDDHSKFNGLNMEYRTKHTGYCKPTFAKTWRGIYFTQSYTNSNNTAVYGTAPDPTTTSSGHNSTSASSKKVSPSAHKASFDFEEQNYKM